MGTHTPRVVGGENPNGGRLKIDFEVQRTSIFLMCAWLLCMTRLVSQVSAAHVLVIRVPESFYLAFTAFY
jgi:hypothetical protein